MNNLVRLIETGVHALERDRRFEFAWKHLRSSDQVWGPLLDVERQLHAAGQLFGEVREKQEEVPETVAMLAEPEEQDMDDHESNASTDVAQDHMRDPEVEWLEPPVEAPVETPAQRMSHFLALRLVWGFSIGPRLTTSRGMQPRMIVFSVPTVCSQMIFQNFR